MMSARHSPVLTAHSSQLVAFYSKNIS